MPEHGGRVTCADVEAIPCRNRQPVLRVEELVARVDPGRVDRQTRHHRDVVFAPDVEQIARHADGTPTVGRAEIRIELLRVDERAAREQAHAVNRFAVHGQFQPAMPLRAIGAEHVRDAVRERRRLLDLECRERRAEMVAVVLDADLVLLRTTRRQRLPSIRGRIRRGLPRRERLAVVGEDRDIVRGLHDEAEDRRRERVVE